MEMDICLENLIVDNLEGYPGIIHSLYDLNARASKTVACTYLN